MQIDIDEFKRAIPVEEYYRRLLGEPARNNGKGWVYFCPFHDDRKTPNLHILSAGNFQCFACGESGDLITFQMKREGQSFLEALNEMAKQYAPDLIPAKETMPDKSIETTYGYQSENEELLFQVVRYSPKDFRQRRPDGNRGWIYNLKGVDLVLYRLPDFLSQSEAIYICEGEKDADRLWEEGFAATTCPGGGGKWRDEYNCWLEDRDVVILPDNDDVGRGHAEKVARSLQGTAKSIKVVHLPDLPEKGDVSDYLKTHSHEDLLKEVEQVMPYAGPPALWDLLESWEEIRSMDIEIKWLVEGLIPEGAVTVLFGKGGIGKSWLVMDLARSIGSGIPFLGLQTRQSPVVMVDFENPLAVLNSRIKKLGEAKEGVKIWRSGADGKKPPRLDAKDWDGYKDLPKGSMLIFDTLRAAQSRDENDSAQMGLIMNRLKELRDMGHTIIVLHHTAKNSDRAQGVNCYR